MIACVSAFYIQEDSKGVLFAMYWPLNLTNWIMQSCVGGLAGQTCMLICMERVSH